MRGERLIKANLVAKKRLKLKQGKWEDRDLLKPNEGKFAWGARLLSRCDIGWYNWQLGTMDCAWGPNEAMIGRHRCHQTLGRRGKSKKGQPRQRGPRWDFSNSRYVRRRQERELCLGFVTGRIELDGDWDIDGAGKRF